MFFQKKFIAPRTAENICQKWIGFGVIADCQKERFTHIPIIFRMKGFHQRENILNRFILNSSYKSGYIFVVVVERTADNTGSFNDVGYSYFFF